MKSCLAVLIVSLLMLFPVVVGVASLAPPPPRALPNRVLVTKLSELPDDGVPHLFRVCTERRDAWQVFPNEPIATVYLRRVSESRIPVAIDPITKVGCPVTYEPQRRLFLDSCWNFWFELDGKSIQPSPHPDLNRPQVEVDGDNVWIPVFPDGDSGLRI